MRPAARSSVRLPVSSSAVESIMPNTLSPAASMRASGPLSAARCLSGASSISAALRKTTKSPGDSDCVRACHKAMENTTAIPTAAMNCVTGVAPDQPTCIFIAKRRSFQLTAPKRSRSCAWPP